MSCVVCIESLPLNKCSDEIVIGVYAPGNYVFPEVDVIVLVRNVSNDRSDYYEVTTVEGGKIKLNSSALKFNENNLYEISIADPSEDNIFIQQPFIIEGYANEITCVNVRFKPVYKDKSLLNISTQAIVKA